TSPVCAPASWATTANRTRACPRADGAPPTLEDVFRDVAGSGLDDSSGDFRDVRSTRRTAQRVG
ncbi:ABC transporter ATP-binding protein, partial [Streptomyces seoulensis]